MKKTFIVTLFLMLVLIGCSSQESSPAVEKQISKISISDATGFEFNTDFILLFEDKESIDIFDNAISTAEKQPGMVDIVEPDFSLEVAFTDGSEDRYFLWLDETLNGAIIMNIYDTHTIYTVSDDIATQLKTIIYK